MYARRELKAWVKENLMQQCPELACKVDAEATGPISEELGG